MAGVDRLSIVIPTLNNSRYLDLCLKALDVNNSLDNEILIHMDGCTDNTRDIIKEYKKRTSLNIIVSESEQRGLYSATNSAFRNASADYFILGNDDLVFGPDWDVNFLKACKPNRIMCPWMVEAGLGSYTQNMDFGNTPETFDITAFDNYVRESMEEEFVLDWTVGMWSASTEVFKEFNGCDEAFDPFGRGGKELLYRIRVVHPEFEFGALKSSLVYHFSAACKRENNRDHLVNLQTWDDKYPEIKSQEANDLLEANRDYFDIEKTDEFKKRCLNGHLGNGLI